MRRYLYPTVFLMLAMLIISSCDLFYPPYYYDALINATNKIKQLDGVFVSINTGNDSNPGTNAGSPVRNVAVGYSNAVQYGKNNVYVAAGDYIPGTGFNSVIGVPITGISGFHLYGGYSDDFKSRPGQTRLNGMGTTQLFYITNSQSITIDGFVIMGGSAGSGGGIFLRNVNNAILNNLVFSNNIVSANGGGIYIENCTGVRIMNCNISHNTSTGSGGGVFAQYCGSLEITSAIITNSSSSGGGICLFNCINTVIGGIISNNACSVSGGGIYMDGGCSGSVIYGSIIGNTSSGTGGGGIYLNNCTNTTIIGFISANSASASGSDYGGGGVYVYGGAANMIVGSTIIGNSSAMNGMGVFFRPSDSLSSLTIDNCVITNDYCLTNLYWGVITIDNYFVTLSGLIISSNLIGGVPGTPILIGIEEASGDTSGHTIINNTFITNTLNFLYFDYYSTQYRVSNSQCTILNTTGTPMSGVNTGAAAAYGNKVWP